MSRRLTTAFAVALAATTFGAGVPAASATPTHEAPHSVSSYAKVDRHTPGSRALAEATQRAAELRATADRLAAGVATTDARALRVARSAAATAVRADQRAVVADRLADEAEALVAKLSGRRRRHAHVPGTGSVVPARPRSTARA
ncbi:hypothetical protein [Mobilicoccus pelagius]|uniref:Glycoside hydrolase n=1 Tax=Mobilicoccus pelagius NBRC 104925 TaxID=1089455 RepID=H5US52_9MICO|nr:hypothetical protein [Mobilicoccus pelagius]GAB48560.1 hypothetical protein MOPEL_074_00470 [Mobilicoccus pelagius NBRC 104925]